MITISKFNDTLVEDRGLKITNNCSKLLPLLSNALYYDLVLAKLAPGRAVLRSTWNKAPWQSRHCVSVIDNNAT